jgi:uncharacterized membrane-anchored protein
MNALIQIGAIVALTWMTWWFLDNTSGVTQAALGFVMVVLTFMVLAWFLQAIIEDSLDTIASFRERRKTRTDRR